MTGPALTRITCLAAVFCLGMQAPALATRVALIPNSGHPGATIKVKGSRFAPNEAVDVYFDTTDELLVATNGNGAFRNRGLPVPSNALPGEHWVTAIGRRSGLAAQAAFTVSTDWPMYNFADNRNGNNPYENLLSAGNAPGLATEWSLGISENAFINSSPAVAGGAVYVGSADSNLYAFDASSGALLWTGNTGGAVMSSPAVVNGVVYVGSFDNRVYAFDAATGSELWRSVAAANAIESSPAVANGVVYVGSLDGNLYAFDASTGAQLWSANAGAPLYSSPSLANGVGYIGTAGGTLYAFNASSGAILWQVSTAVGENITGAPTVANGAVYVGNFDYSDFDFFALNATTGSLLWETKLGRVIDSSAAVANGVLYVETDGQYTHTDNDVIAINASTGAIIWQTQVPTSNGGGIVMSSPAIANGVLYVGSGGGTLYAFDAATGTALWNSGTLGEFIFSSPVVANGTVYIDTGSNSNTGALYAFGLNGGKRSVSPGQRAAPDTHSLHPDWRLPLSVAGRKPITASPAQAYRRTSASPAP